MIPPREPQPLGSVPLETIVAEDDSIRLAQLRDPSAPHSLNIASGGYPMDPGGEEPRRGVDVVGAGMAGLLAAAMLRKDCSGVYDSQPGLPNNHSAVLRFRGTAVADTLGIEFKAVDTLKAVEQWSNPIADAMAYSRKTNGTATLRSVLTADGKMSRRYIAPPDLISRMAAMVEAPFNFGHEYPFWAFRSGGPIISTIPMPALMKALDYNRRDTVEFRVRSGTNIIANLRYCDAYCSLYVPDPKWRMARISITGSQMVIECYGTEALPDPKGLACAAADMMGLPPSSVIDVQVKEQRYAKILPIDEGERRRFIMWASDNYGIYSLGRYATWRPGLLLDDVVQDVRVIQRLINNRAESYAHKLKG